MCEQELDNHGLPTFNRMMQRCVAQAIRCIDVNFSDRQHFAYLTHVTVRERMFKSCAPRLSRNGVRHLICLIHHVILLLVTS
ncbi:MAG: hypothetical protein BWY76_00201 [bacterium ADurb.Bin429]|nr:MAG: hypothetical protein BWY76_00201 [bacterium ADurb.Bin429]